MQSNEYATWLDLMPAYLEHLRLKNRSPRTIELRTYQLKRFFMATGHLPAAVTIEDLRGYMDTDRWSPNSKQVVKSSLAGFFKFLYEEEILLGKNPALRLESPKVPHGAPKPASDEAVAQALASASPRVRLMVQIGIFTGLRAMEIAAIKSSDVVFTQAGASLRVLGKGSKTRIVPLSDDVASLILSDDPGYLFPGKNGSHLSPAYISRLVSQVLPPGVTCHKLRHRFASRAYLNSGNDLRAVQMLLGHASIATTEFYVQVADDSLRAAALSAA